MSHFGKHFVFHLWIPAAFQEVGWGHPLIGNIDKRYPWKHSQPKSSRRYFPSSDTGIALVEICGVQRVGPMISYQSIR